MLCKVKNDYFHNQKRGGCSLKWRCALPHGSNAALRTPAGKQSRWAVRALRSSHHARLASMLQQDSPRRKRPGGNECKHLQEQSQFSKHLKSICFWSLIWIDQLKLSGNWTMACSPGTCGLHLSPSPDPSQEQAVVHQGSTLWEPTSLLNYLPVTADISPIAAYKSIHILLM